MDELITLYSEEAEKAVLGAMMIDGELMDTISISPGDFYFLKHQEIMRAILSVRAAGRQVDYLTVLEDLRGRSMLDNAGGVGYLTGLCGGNYMTYNTASYAEIVKEKARRRSMLQVANALAKAAIDESASMDAKLPGIITQIANGANVKSAARPLADFMSALYDDVSARAENPTDIWGMRTGFQAFDRITGGIQPGEVMIISGPPGVGKTRLAIQMACQMGEYNPGAIYELEMGGMAISRRMVSGYGRFPGREMKTGRITAENWHSLTGAIEHYSQLPIYMSDDFDWDTNRMRADLARLKAQYDVKWFVLDYLFLLQDGAGLEEIERTALASAGLKRICKDLGVGCIAVHSQNKGGMGEQGVPDQSSLRGSGQVVYDADLICFMTNYNQNLDPNIIKVPYKDQQNVKTLWFGKGRELEDPRKFIHFVGIPNSPFFGEREEK